MNSNEQAAPEGETNSRIGDSNSSAPFEKGVNQFEESLISTCLTMLYDDGENKRLDFDTEILAPNNIQISDNNLREKYWDFLIKSPFIEAVIGFGNNDKLQLSEVGLELMQKFGSYENFLKQTKKQ
ncbi:MAG TPA: hypothetical protein PKX92_12490 [Edaphocola sp.]|nr:hypothetical protein [Edaphocola sp.]